MKKTCQQFQGILCLEILSEKRPSNGDLKCIKNVIIPRRDFIVPYCYCNKYIYNKTSSSGSGGFVQKRKAQVTWSGKYGRQYSASVLPLTQQQPCARLYSHHSQSFVIICLLPSSIPSQSQDPVISYRLASLYYVQSQAKGVGDSSSFLHSPFRTTFNKKLPNQIQCLFCLLGK